MVSSPRVMQILLIMIALLLAVPAAHSQSLRGQWEFEADLTASFGFDLFRQGSLSTTYTSDTINGQPANVLVIDNIGNDSGLFCRPNLNPDIGARANNWSLMMDIAVTGVSGSSFMALIETDYSLMSDQADLFWSDSGTGGQIGAPDLGFTPVGPALGQWARVIIAFDGNNQKIQVYIDGVQVGEIDNYPVDGRLSISPTTGVTSWFFLFCDDGGMGNFTGSAKVNSMQIRDYALSPEEAADYGGPTGPGIPTTVRPTATITGIKNLNSPGIVTNSQTTSYTATFNTDVAGFALGDILTTNAIVSNLVYVSTGVFTFRATAITSGPVELQIAENSVTNAGTGFPNFASPVYNFGYDPLHPITDQLVLLLHLENDPVDSSVYGNDGLLLGNTSPTFGSSQIGDFSLCLEGGESGESEQFVRVPETFELFFSNDVDFSISFWMQSPDLSNSPPLFANRSIADPFSTGWSFQSDLDGNVEFTIGDGNGETDIPIGDLDDNQWHNVLVTVDRDDFMHAYLDGVYVGQIDISLTSGVLRSDSMFLALGIDGRLGGPLGATEYYGGYFDDVAIWRRRISIEEIERINSLGAFGRSFDPITNPEVVVFADDIINNDPTGYQATSFTVMFSEPVTGFDASDFLTTNAVITQFNTVSSNVFTITLQAITSGTLSSIQVPGNIATASITGLQNLPSNVFNFTWTGILPNPFPLATRFWPLME